MQDHYKLYEGDAEKVNECRRRLDELDRPDAVANQADPEMHALSIDYASALLEYKNHDLYFAHLGGEGGGATGRFAELAESQFNGLDSWLDAMKKAASVAGGWVIVGYDLDDGSLFNYILDSQDAGAVYGVVPVLALDVYEHAYAADFGATPEGRKEYVEAFFRNLDWNHVNQHLGQAEAARRGATEAAEPSLGARVGHAAAIAGRARPQAPGAPPVR
jgi:Fe-Mn family superoxide dismutase